MHESGNFLLSFFSLFFNSNLTTMEDGTIILFSFLKNLDGNLLREPIKMGLLDSTVSVTWWQDTDLD